MINITIIPLCSCSTSISCHYPGPGTLLMVGGNLQEDNRDIWTSMVQLAGGEGVSCGV